MMHRLTRPVAAIGLATVLTLAACGSDDGNSSPTTSDDVTTTDPAETSTPGDTVPSSATTDVTSDETSQYAAGDTVPGDDTTGRPEVVLPDGEVTELVVTDLIEGTGDPLEAGDTIVANYVGVLSADGTQFDESYSGGQPISLVVGAGQVIPGWDQGLIGVKAGGRRQIDIPSDLAYGDEDYGPIPGGSALTFVVDVVDVVEPTPPPTLAPQADAADCPAADGSSDQQQEFEEYPPTCIDVTKTYTAEIVTNHGNLVVELDPEQAPVTVNNFVVLARYHYFDDTECHRAIPGFMVQCGDPTATGGGGPGYQFGDELPADSSDYVAGTVAMANRGPNTNGSQFFVITGDATFLPPDYAVFGHVSDGLDDTVPALDALGNDDPAANGVPPLESIVIESVTITES
jgi:cyclophilin family peptidyl-prolyl cis-trans isomerase/FKBP-type peptidyl-prolyl cis-trans isomerase